MRHPLVDESLAHIAIGRRLHGWPTLDFRLLGLPLLAIRQQVVGIASAHDAGAG